jgi:hypothetical protein
MPRRKKKSSLATRPSLVFTESPVHVQNNVPSPVLCARCPPTANSIPVDELHNLSWVLINDLKNILAEKVKYTFFYAL